MKPIKIELKADMSYPSVSTETKDAIENALHAVNGAAMTFTVTSAQKVAEIAFSAEKHLQKHGVQLSDRGGAKASYKPAGPSANAYRNSAISTFVVLRRKSGRDPIWYLDEVVRTEVWPRNPERFNVMITDSAARNLVKRTLAAFGRKELPLGDLQAAA